MLEHLSVGDANVRHVRQITFGDLRVDEYALHNGLTVLHVPDHRAPLFSYQTWFRVGSRHERAGKTGIAHLFEHLMFKGTHTRPEGEFDRTLEGLGGRINAATWLDWTYYYEDVPDPANLPLVVELEADRLENMLLVSDQLESERKVVINERKERVDNDPTGKLDEVLWSTAFTTHPYGQPTIGWMPDIEGLSRADCLDFYKLHYSPNNATICVVGDFDVDEALTLIDKRYGAMPAQPIPAEDVRVEPRQTAPRRKVLQLPVATDKAVYAWHGPAASDPTHAAWEVLAEVLAGGESSRLYRRLVTDEEVATEVAAWVSSWNQPGLFEIALHVRPGETVARAEAIITEELAKLGNELSERELAKAQNGLETFFWRGIADTSSRARGMGHAETTVGDFRWFFGQGDRYRAVTRDAVAEAAATMTEASRTAVIAHAGDKA